MLRCATGAIIDTQATHIKLTMGCLSQFECFILAEREWYRCIPIHPYVCVAWTYPGGRLEGACQHVVHGQLGVVAPRLGGAHALGGRDEEAVLSPASTA